MRGRSEMNSTLESPNRDLEISKSDLASVKRLRGRENIARFFRAWWIPIASAVGGFSAGTVAMIVHNRLNSYPYAAAIAATAMVPSSVGARSGRRLLLVSVPLILVSFVLGLKAGDIILPEKHLAVVADYGVTHEEAQ